MQINKKLNILAFAPYAGIWEHSFPEAVTLKALEDIADIHYTGCNSILNSYCITMSAVGMSIDASAELKEKLCALCKKRRNLLTSSFGFFTSVMEDMLDDKDISIVQQFLIQTSKYNFEHLVIDGFELGKIAMYEVLLAYKKNNTDFSNEEWNYYLSSLQNTLIAYLSVKKLFDSKQYDRVFIYNTLYSTNNIVYQLAKFRGIPIYCLHAGMNWSNRLDTMIVARNTTFEYEDQVVEQWSKFKNTHLTPNEARSISKHFENIINANSVFNYSEGLTEKFNFYDKFPKSHGKKIFLATLSSEDERFAYKAVGQRDIISAKLFKTQLEWITWLINYFKSKPDTYLIIRVHPREFPNKRDRLTSENAKQMKQMFHTLPENIAVNWPDDKISIYALATEVDVLLNSHSSAGLDFMLLGLPVVVYDKGILTFPLDLHYYGFTLEKYAEAIEKALEDGWNFKNTYNLFKWMHLKLNLSIFDLTEGTRYFYRKNKLHEKILSRICKSYQNRRDLFFSKSVRQDRLHLQQMVLQNKNTKLDVLSVPIGEVDDKIIIQNELKYIFNRYIEKLGKTKLANHIHMFLNIYKVE